MTSIIKIVTVWRDQSQRPIQIPTLLTGDGRPLEVLLNYQLANSSRSLSWHRRVTFSIQKLLRYSEANPHELQRPHVLFENFLASLDNGTITNGLDPSGLYWIALRREYSESICYALTRFSKYSADFWEGQVLSTSSELTWREKLCKAAGNRYRQKNSFLSHLGTRGVSSQVGGAGKSVLRRKPRVRCGEVHFPEDRFSDLIFKGFAVHPHVQDPWLRLNVRDALITILLHGGGIRCSEAFHMFINDVAPNPLDPESALIRIGHPRLGEITWKNPAGTLVTTTRQEYLRQHGYPQRDEVVGPLHVGWKNPTLDGSYYLQVRWGHPGYGKLFLGLWKLYHRKYLSLPNRPLHPWAWVSFDAGNEGSPLKIKRYAAAHARAVTRIGLAPRRREGTTPHCHRHSYSKWLRDLGLQRQTIRRFLHHNDLSSQEAYTESTELQMHDELRDALRNMQTPSKDAAVDHRVRAEDGILMMARLARELGFEVPALADEIAERRKATQ